MALRKITRDIIGSAIGLGIGGSVLGGLAPSMPAGTSDPLISKTIGTGGRMIGVVVPAAYGMEVIKMLKPKKRRRK